MSNPKILDWLKEFLEASREKSKLTRRRWLRNVLSPMIAGTAAVLLPSHAEAQDCGTNICAANNSCIGNYCTAVNICQNKNTCTASDGCGLQNECHGGNISGCAPSTNICKTSDLCSAGTNTCRHYDICSNNDLCNGSENQCNAIHSCNRRNICTEDDGCWGANICMVTDEDCGWCDISCNPIMYGGS